MFSSNLSESTQDVVTMSCVSGAILGELIDYAYTSEIKVTRTNVQNLLAAANLLGFSPLIQNNYRKQIHE